MANAQSNAAALLGLTHYIVAQLCGRWQCPDGMAEIKPSRKHTSSRLGGKTRAGRRVTFEDYNFPVGDLPETDPDT